MSKFKITVFSLIDVKSDDPEGRKVSVTVLTIQRHLPQPAYLHIRGGEKNTTLRSLSTVMAFSAIKDLSRLPWVTESVF